jgi:S-adenosylmethionine hydrolase
LSVKIITLTSDFGLRDPYAAEMKAAILGICPHAVIVDVTHIVEKFNMLEGAFVLASATPYFPDGSIHVAVVDPLVGTQRRPIIVETKRGFFVGPDNGILMLAAEAQGVVRAREITSRKLMLPHISGTFHGRDVFAPAAAHLAKGVSPEEFGPEITDPIVPQFTKVMRSHDTVSGEVLHVDGFGNIITNIPGANLASFRGSMVQVDLPNQKPQMKVIGTYADARLNEPLVLVGSHGYAEIAVNQGNAAERFQAKAGDKVTLTRT